MTSAFTLGCGPSGDSPNSMQTKAPTPFARVPCRARDGDLHAGTRSEGSSRRWCEAALGSSRRAATATGWRTTTSGACLPTTLRHPHHRRGFHFQPVAGVCGPAGIGVSALPAGVRAASHASDRSRPAASCCARGCRRPLRVRFGAHYGTLKRRLTVLATVSTEPAPLAKRRCRRYGSPSTSITSLQSDCQELPLTHRASSTTRTRLHLRIHRRAICQLRLDLDKARANFDRLASTAARPAHPHDRRPARHGDIRQQRSREAAQRPCAYPVVTPLPPCIDAIAAGFPLPVRQQDPLTVQIASTFPSAPTNETVHSGGIATHELPFLWCGRSAWDPQLRVGSGACSARAHGTIRLETRLPSR